MRHDSGYFEEQQLGKSYDLKLLKRLLPFLKPHRWMIIVSIILVMFITLLDLAIPYVTKIAIDQYIVPNMEEAFQRDSKEVSDTAHSRYLKVEPDSADVQAVINRHPSQFRRSGQSYLISYQQLAQLQTEEIALLRQNHLNGITRVTAAFLLIIMLSFGFNFLQKIVMEYTGHRMMNDLRLALFDHVQHLSMPFFTQNPVGRLVTRVTNDIQNMHELFTSVISLVFKDFFLLIGIAAVLIVMNWKLALFSFLVMPLVGYTSFAFSGRIRDAFRVLRIKVAEINTTFAEMIDGIGVIQSFCKETIAAHRFAQLNHENYLAGMRQIHVLAVFMPLIEVFGIVTVAVIIFYGGQSVLNEAISLGVLVAFISYMRMFFRPIRDLAEKYNILQNALASAERIFLILDTPNVIDTQIHTNDVKEKARSVPPALPKIETIALERLSFEYLPAEPVLTDISLKIQAGESVAIIGPTGSGKTSIANLIMRFYDPVSGVISLNGQDIKNLNVADYRAKMAFVTQEPYLFSDTIRANIWRDQVQPSAAEITRVLSAANCQGVVAKQTHGLDTVLSRGGASLSSGERQLISIARAFARDPELIILDEATSYIDSLTEDAIQDALSKLMTGRTALVIAHRLSTVRQADTIIVLDKGHIMEHGNHEALMQKQGFYFRMNQLQHCIGKTC